VSMVMIVFGVAIALAAAARSTWSPCGQSMLSQITPVAEAGRGQKFGRTATWFVFGAVLGGITLGGVMAAVAAGVGAAKMSADATLALVAAFALLGAAIDSGVLGFAPPFLRRQVDEVWLTKYRSWVYGSGFGWQIGAGVTTYVMTAAVPLTIVVGVLTGSPAAAFGIGVLFGLARGLAVLLGVPLRTLADLHAFHRRFTVWAEPVRRGVIGVQLAVAVLAAWMATPVVIAVGITVGAVALVAWARVQTSARTRLAA
jgi:hypothetical protein